MFGRLFRTLILLVVIPLSAQASDLAGQTGWVVHPTQKSYQQVIKDLTTAVQSKGLIVVTQAGPTQAAAARGITIPGNRVLGVFNNDYAVRVLSLSTAAMIEAPIRFYVTENPDKTATLSYKRPSFVFAPYMASAGQELQKIAEELDIQFDEIANITIR